MITLTAMQTDLFHQVHLNFTVRTQLCIANDGNYVKLLFIEMSLIKLCCFQKLKYFIMYPDFVGSLYTYHIV